MKKINRYSIDKYFKKLEIETERKTPKDIKEILKTERFSESLGQPIAYGKMTVEHFVRSLIKENNYWLDVIMDKNKKIRELKRERNKYKYDL